MLEDVLLLGIDGLKAAAALFLFLGVILILEDGPAVLDNPLGKEDGIEWRMIHEGIIGIGYQIGFVVAKDDAVAAAALALAQSTLGLWLKLMQRLQL